MTANLARTPDSGVTTCEAGSGLHWTDLPAVKHRLNRKVSADSDIDWLDYTLRRYFADSLPLARCYSLGCGHGEVERRLARLGAFAICEASDISADAIAAAQRMANAEGLDCIHYTVSDANTLSLAPQTYDAIWARASVHHFEQLEHVFMQVAGALAPGGLFILSEYIGPNRFQFPSVQRQAIQACLDLLPAAYRRMSLQAAHARLSNGEQSPCGGGQPHVSGQPRVLPHDFAQRLLDKWRDGDLRAAVARRLQLLRAVRQGKGPEKSNANLPTKRSLIAVDPSEAVRSADIVPVLQQYFNIVEFKPLGGTILQFLLADIAGNFERDAYGARLLQMLFEVEDSLIETGVLQNDFAYIVAKPNRGGNG